MHNSEALCGSIQITSLSYRMAEFGTNKRHHLRSKRHTAKFRWKIFACSLPFLRFSGENFSRLSASGTQLTNFFPMSQFRSSKKVPPQTAKNSIYPAKKCTKYVNFPLLKSGRGDEEKKVGQLRQTGVSLSYCNKFEVLEVEPCKTIAFVFGILQQSVRCNEKMLCCSFNRRFHSIDHSLNTQLFSGLVADVNPYLFIVALLTMMKQCIISPPKGEVASMPCY